MGFMKRKQYLINPSLQLTVIGFNLILALIMIGIFYIAASYLFSKFTGVETALVMDDPIIAEMIETERARLYRILGFTGLGVIAVLVFGGLILSHRIAGPIYHLKKHMREINHGEPVSDLKFRKNDFFTEITDEYNKLLKKVKS